MKRLFCLLLTLCLVLPLCAAMAEKASFVVGGVTYTVSELDDTPEYAIPNRMDGRDGHLVWFSYAGSGAAALSANAQLYTNARLLQPDGEKIRAYSNDDNAGNPYGLYFGLSDGVTLADCVFTLLDNESVSIPLSSLGGEEAAAETAVTGASGVLTDPESVTVRFENTDYTLSVTGISTDENGEYTVTLSGFGGTLFIRNNVLVAHVQAEIVAGGETYNWYNLSVDGGDSVTFSFHTSTYPEKINLYSYDDATRREMTVLAAEGPVEAAVVATGGVPEELVGDWQGTARDGIKLAFTINADGSGRYTFLQQGYEESYDFTLESEDNTFSLDIPADNQLGISSCAGTYAYADGVLTLNITTSFAAGGEFAYTVACTRVEAAEPTEEPTSEPTEEPTAEPTEEPTPEPTEEPTPEPTEEPTPEPTEEPSVDADALVSALLEELAQTETDPWRLAIYEAGCEDAQALEGSVSARLRSFNPGLETLGDYAADKAAYLEGLLANVAAYDIEVALETENDAITEAGRKALTSAVSSAASAAKSAFDRKETRVAIAEWLFPAPNDSVKSAADILETDEAFDAWIETSGRYVFDWGSRAWAPLFYGQRKQTLSVNGGPHALALNCISVEPETITETARADTVAYFSKIAYANQSEHDEIEAKYLENLCACVYARRDRGDTKFTLTLDVDDLVEGYAGADYSAYMNRYDYAAGLEAAADAIYDMPDYPALDYPKSGRISGSSKGTKVIVKTGSNKTDAHYIQLRNYDTDELVVSAFIRPGGSCTLYVPKGSYYFLIASGQTWYGEEELFGSNGDYSHTELFEVASRKYYHTVTLQVTEKGNMSSYSEDPSAFSM